MPNHVELTVENPEELRNAGAYGTGALMRLQAGATETGSFADVTGTGSTPTIPILDGVRSYDGYDPNGIASSWYQYRYEGASRASDWSAAWQVGDETAGLLCSLYDVKQRIMGTATVSTSEDELLLEIIREVSDDIEDYVGQWLAPRPTNPASTTVLTFDVPGPWLWAATRSLLLERGGKRTGIRSFTSVGVASTSQPDTGGTYTTATAADLIIRPVPTTGDPGLRLEFLPTINGAVAYFRAGANTVQVTGSFGPASVAPRIQSVALAMVTRRWLGKETAAAAVAVGPDGGVKLLSDIPPGMRDTLDRMRVPNVA